MKKNKGKQEEVNEQEELVDGPAKEETPVTEEAPEAVEEQEGADQDGEKGELGEEEVEKTAGEAESGEESIEELGKITKEAWKEAVAILKKANEETSYSIDERSHRLVIDSFRKRFNDKERSADLYYGIYGLKKED